VAGRRRVVGYWRSQSSDSCSFQSSASSRETKAPTCSLKSGQSIWTYHPTPLSSGRGESVGPWVGHVEHYGTRKGDAQLLKWLLLMQSQKKLELLHLAAGAET
jgi:hypothetical protein